jgi:hypothetical protein
MGSFPFKVLLI